MANPYYSAGMNRREEFDYDLLNRLEQVMLS